MEEGEQVFLDVSGYGVVVSLEDGGEDRASSGLDVIDLLDIGGFEVGETELLRGEVSICGRNWVWGASMPYSFEFSCRI